MGGSGEVSGWARFVPAAYRPALRLRGVRRVLGGYGISAFGDGMSAVAVAWLAVELAHGRRTGLLVGAAVAAYTLPGLVGSVALGRWLRQVAPARLMAADAALRTVALGAIPLVFWAGALRPAVYVGLLALSSLLHAWGVAGRYTTLAQLTPGPDRLAVNSLLSTQDQLSLIVGPAVAGLVVAGAGPAAVLALDAVTWAVLAIVAARLPAVPGADDAQARRSRQSGTAVLRQHPPLIALLAVTWFFNFLYGPVEVALPVFVAGHPHGSGAVYGLYLTAFGIGGVAGAAGATALRRLSIWPISVAIIAGWGLALLPFGFTGSIPLTIACFGVGGLIYGPFNALSYTLFQAETPEGDLASVLAVRGSLMLTATPLGTALGGPLVAAVGAAATFELSALTTIALAVVTAAVLVIRRQARPARAEIQSSSTSTTSAETGITTYSPCDRTRKSTS